MLGSYHRAADDLDLKAWTHERGSLVRNLATVSFPVAVITFGVSYGIWRSATMASVLAAGLFLASLISNIRFFRDVRRRERLKKDTNAVEVLEVSASSAFHLEPVGDDAPAFCFFVGDGKALLLVGRGEGE